MKDTFLISSQRSQVKTGNVETQPLPIILDDKNRLSADVSLNNVSYVVRRDETSQVTRGQSITSIVNDIKINNPILTTLRGENINRVDFDDANAVQQDQPIVSNDTISYSEYESLAGMSQSEPQIILLTDFKPIYSLQRLNENGVFFDKQNNIKKVKNHNIKHIIDFNKKISDKFETQLQNRVIDFNSKISHIENYLSFIKLVILESDNTNVFSKQILLSTTYDESYVPTNYSENMITSLEVKETLTPKLFLKNMGFDEEAVSENFLSTKIGFQFLTETKDAVKFHSPVLINLQDENKRNDSSKETIINKPINYYQFSDRLYLKDSSIPSLNFFRSYDPQDTEAIKNATPSQWSDGETVYGQPFYGFDVITPEAREYFSKLQTEFGSLQQNSFENLESDLAANIYDISKEFDMSNRLNLNETKVFLKTKFNYDVDLEEVKTSIFDSIFGYSGDDVATAAANTVKTSLGSVFSYQEGNIRVLPFEKKLPASLETSFVSGFSTNLARQKERIEQYAENLRLLIDNFSQAINKLNLLSIRDSNFSVSQLFYGDLINDLGLEYDNNTALNLSNSDKLIFSLFEWSFKDSYMSFLLFLYCIINDNNEKFRVVIEGQITKWITENVRYRLPSVSQETLSLQAFETVSTIRSLDFIAGSNNLLDVMYVTKFDLSEHLRNSPLIKSIKSRLMLPELQQIGQIGEATFYRNYPALKVAMSLFQSILKMIQTENPVNKYSFYGMFFSDGVDTSDGFFIGRKQSQYNGANVIQLMKNECLSVRTSVLCLLNVLKTLHVNCVNYKNFLNSLVSSTQYREISQIFSSDEKLINLLFDNRQHLSLIKNQFNLIKDSLVKPVTNIQNQSLSWESTSDLTTAPGQVQTDSSEIKSIDESLTGDRLYEILRAYLKEDVLSSHEATNLKIMTIGIPHKLFQNFLFDENARNTQRSRKNGLLTFEVYKVNQQHPDIILKPQMFTFEISRFPVMSDNLIQPVVRDSQSIYELINLVPTRRYDVELPDSQLGFLNPEQGQRAAFDQGYSFLTELQKKEIYKNHIVSMLLEHYLKIMTGISTNDSEFQFLFKDRGWIDSDLIKLLTDVHIENYVSSKDKHRPRTRGRLFFDFENYAGTLDPNLSTSDVTALSHYTNNSTISKAITDAKSSLLTLSRSQINPLLHQLSVISEFSRTFSNVSNPSKLEEYILTPKIFDRIFNVMIDTNAFTIDEQLTRATYQGNSELDSLLRQGIITQVEKDTSNQFLNAGQNIQVQPQNLNIVANPLTGNAGSQTQTKDYVFAKRNRSENNIIFEKYFVAVKTFSEEEF
jgi:hypothetical protein